MDISLFLIYAKHKSFLKFYLSQQILYAGNTSAHFFQILSKTISDGQTYIRENQLWQCYDHEILSFLFNDIPALYIFLVENVSYQSFFVVQTSKIKKFI